MCLGTLFTEAEKVLLNVIAWLMANDRNVFVCDQFERKWPQADDCIVSIFLHEI